MTTSKPGHIVHPHFGAGTILQWTRGGTAALVQFAQDAAPREVLRREFDESFTLQPHHEFESLAVPEKAALSIEAMRLGVVPSMDLKNSTVGRDYEISLIEEDFHDTQTQGGARRAFLGEYGQGKTHLLELIQQMALKQNYLVSKVVLDHSENAPSQPKRIYHSIIKNLVYPDRPQALDGLRPLLEKAIEKPQVLESFLVSGARKERAGGIKSQVDRGLHLYLSPALSYFKALSHPDTLRVSGLGPEESPHVWAKQAQVALMDWLEGHTTQSNQDINDELSRIKGSFPRIYSLLDFRPWARIYGYLLNGISTLAKLLGYAGMVIVIDEAEFYSLLSAQNRMFARHLFRSWSLAASGDNEADLPFTKEDLITGGYGIQRELPAQYSKDSGLYLVFAMTPNSEGVKVLHEAVEAQRICFLTPLSDLDYLQITEHLCELYGHAYPDHPLPEGITGPLADVINGLVQQGLFNNPRQAMKFLTEFLDIVRYLPEEVPQVLGNLMSEALY